MAKIVDVKGGGGDFNQEFEIPADVANNNAPAANTAAVVNLALDAQRGNIIGGISFGYSATPTGGSLQIEDGSGTVVYGPIPVPAAGFQNITFSPPMVFTKNRATIVTLAAGGGAVVGALYVNAWLKN